jgi:F-type H+-transporting ATPase subunit delta
MISSTILDRYARSLVDVVAQAKEEEEVSKDLALYRDMFLAVPDILDAFDSPAFPRESKEKVLSELIARYPIRQLSANFLKVLLKHNRIRYFQQIYEACSKLFNERKGIIAAKVVVAAPLAQPELAGLRDVLGKITGKNVTLDVREEQDVLGGVIVQIGSTIYDGSIRTQLAEMKRQLTEI